MFVHVVLNLKVLYLNTPIGIVALLVPKNLLLFRSKQKQKSTIQFILVTDCISSVTACVKIS